MRAATKPFLLTGAALSVLVWAAAPLAGQSVYGRVLSAHQREALPGADVALLDSGGATVMASAVTDSTGAFSLDLPRGGSYLLVASLPGFVSAAPREVDVEAVARQRVDLELVPLDLLTERTRSARRLGESAERACRDQLNPRSSAIMGVVRDSLAEVALTGVSVVLEQVTADGRLRPVMEAETDGDGFFAFCPLPAPRELAVRADLGSDRTTIIGVETEPGTGTFVNLTVGLATTSAPSDIVGVVRDWETGQPLSGSRVTLAGLGRTVTSDVEGRFLFRDLPYGVYLVEVDHLGYGTAREAFYLNGGATANVEVALTVDAIEVDPITVSVEQRRQIYGDLAAFEERRKAGLGLFLTADDLERKGVGPATPLYAALQGLPSVRVRKSGAYGYSVQLRSAFGLTGGTCQPTLYVDGIKFDLDPEIGFGEPIGAIQAMEIYRGAAEVPAEFSGSDASCGVIVVWTKRGR